jgi:hypothetical protein
LAAKLEACLFALLVLWLGGCAGAMRQKPHVGPVMLRNVACKKTSESGAVVIADCACNAPAFAFNAKTGEEEIQCAGATK